MANDSGEIPLAESRAVNGVMIGLSLPAWRDRDGAFRTGTRISVLRTYLYLGANMGSSGHHTVQHVVTGPGPEVIDTGSKGYDGALRCSDRVSPGELPDDSARNKRLKNEIDGAHTEITIHVSVIVPAEGASVLDETFLEGDAQRALAGCLRY